MGLSCLIGLHASHETQGMERPECLLQKARNLHGCVVVVEVDNEGKRVVLAVGKGM